MNLLRTLLLVIVFVIGALVGSSIAASHVYVGRWHKIDDNRQIYHIGSGGSMPCQRVLEVRFRGVREETVALTSWTVERGWCE